MLLRGRGKMLCPYCGNRVRFLEVMPGSPAPTVGAGQAGAAQDDEILRGLQTPGRIGGTVVRRSGAEVVQGTFYRCPIGSCGHRIPPQYIDEYRHRPPVQASAIGFNSHGKTVYFASLFLLLRQSPQLLDVWPDFSSEALNIISLQTILVNGGLLSSGGLPKATQYNFPEPTMVRLLGIPHLPDSTLTIHDVSGEVIREDAQERLIRYAELLANASSLFFFLSLDPGEARNPSLVYKQLLERFLIGVRTRIGYSMRTQEKNLIIVYTKADAWQQWGGWTDLQAYIRAPEFEGLDSMGSYLSRMEDVSRRLEEFTRKGLQAGEFVNSARRNFRNVRFCLVSSLGSAPIGHQIRFAPRPRRVLDPLLFLIKDLRDSRRGLWGRVQDMFPWPKRNGAGRT